MVPEPQFSLGDSSRSKEVGRLHFPPQTSTYTHSYLWELAQHRYSHGNSVTLHPHPLSWPAWVPVLWVLSPRRPMQTLPTLHLPTACFVGPQSFSSAKSLCNLLKSWASLTHFVNQTLANTDLHSGGLIPVEQYCCTKLAGIMQPIHTQFSEHPPASPSSSAVVHSLWNMTGVQNM